MSDSPVLFTALVGAATAGWLLASWRAARTAAAVKQDIELARGYLDASTAQQSVLLATRDVELKAAHLSLDEARQKLTAAGEECIRLATLRQSEQHAAAERADEIVRLRLAVAAAETSRDAERARAASLHAEACGVAATLDELRDSHAKWTTSARASEAELKANLAEAVTAADAARTPPRP